MDAAQMMLDGSLEVKRARGVMDELDAFAVESDRRSGLINYSQAAIVLGVHRSRIGQFINEGRLQPVQFFGKDYLGVDDVRAFACEDRKRTGRPKKILDVARMAGHIVADPVQLAEAALYH
jgi:hypothetical protein